MQTWFTFWKTLLSILIIMTLLLGTAQHNFARRLPDKQLSQDKAQDSREAELDLLLAKGVSYKKTGKLPEALSTFQQALDLSRILKDLDAQGLALVLIGDVLSEQRNPAEAIKSKQEAAIIYRNLGDQKGVVISLSGIANAYFDQDQLPEALNYYKQALLVSKKAGLTERSDRLEQIVRNLNLIGAIQRFLSLKAEGKNHEAFLQLREQVERDNWPIQVSPVGPGDEFGKPDPEYVRAFPIFEKHMKLSEALAASGKMKASSNEFWLAIESCPSQATLVIYDRYFSLTSKFDKVRTVDGVEDMLQFLRQLFVRK